MLSWMSTGPAPASTSTWWATCSTSATSGLLEAARQHGDHLVVGVLSDEAVAAYKRRDVSPETVHEVFGPVAAAGRLRLVRYTPGISTTDLIARVRASG